MSDVSFTDCGVHLEVSLCSAGMDSGMVRRSAKKLGRLGEKTLSAWATDADITVNESKEDDTGWDFILEFPFMEYPTTDTARALDLRQAPLECFVQVKSSDGRPGSWQVKLDNWERRIASPLPSFYLVYEFDGKATPQRAYLVHIGHDYIHKVKKRIRELSAKGDYDLHDHYLTFTYDESHRLSSLDGHCLTKAIVSHIPAGLHAYSEAKMKQVANVGYERGTHSIKFIVDLPPDYASDSTEFLVDHLVGIVSKVPLHLLEISDRRFDIEVPGAAKSFSNAYLEIYSKPVGKVTVNFALADFSRDLKIDMDAYAPRPLPLPSSDKRLKLRITRPFLEIIVRFNPFLGTINFNLPISEALYSLRELQPVAELIHLIQKGTVENVVIEQEMTFEGKQLMWGTLDSFETVDTTDEMLKSAEAVTCAWTIARHFNIQDEAKVSTLVLLQNLDMLGFLAGCLDTQRGYIQLTFYADNYDTKRLGKVCCPLVSLIQFGTHYIVLGFAVLGDVTFETTMDDPRGSLLGVLSTTYTPVVGRKLTQDYGEALRFQKRIHELIADKYRAEYAIITLNELHQYLYDDV